MSTLRVSATQFEPRPAGKDHNLAVMRGLVGQAAESGSRMVALPEMGLTGYWHLTKLDDGGLRTLAEPADGPSIQRVKGWSRELDLVIGVGFLEADPSGALFNSYAVCLPDGQLHVHRKLHAFEHPAISSGDRYTVFDTALGVRVGVLICWDNNLVENVRACALLGAEVILAPHQTGGTASRSPHATKVIPREVWDARHTEPERIQAEITGPNGREWLMRWLPSRAHDNGLFVVFSNGVGVDDDEIRTGNAMLLDPYGRVLAETTRAGDEVVTADLDLGLIPLSQGRRWMAGRRPELYDVLVTRTGNERSPREARFSQESVPNASQPATSPGPRD